MHLIRERSKKKRGIEGGLRRTRSYGDLISRIIRKMKQNILRFNLKYSYHSTDIF